MPLTASKTISRRRALKGMASVPVAVSLGGIVPRRSAAVPADARYLDAAAPIAERVTDLLRRMTLDEKVAQMMATWQDKKLILDGLDFDAGKAGSTYPDSIGQLARPSDMQGVPREARPSDGPRGRWRTPLQTVEFVNDLQRWAREDTRLGIPVLVHEEALHGYMATDATMFPQAIALAGTFDTDLVREVNAVIAREARARGIPFVLSPVVDIVRDPRWGRIEETFGEDPFLVGEMGVAAVEGLQGRGKFDKLGGDKVFATLKHMTGHGEPQGGTNVGPAQISERELRENFLAPFREIVERTSVGAVMPSYNEIDGVPSHANQWLLRDVLRGEWAFDSLIVSDYKGVEELSSLHRVASDFAHAAQRSLAAGIDCDLPNGNSYRTLADQVRAGTVDEADIDEAVARILEFKFRAGLFEKPCGDAVLTDEITGNDEARALALKAARRSLCLLTNDGTLPLGRDEHAKVAVIGPNANIARLGGYSSVPQQAVTLLDAIRDLLDGKADVVHAQGVFITTSEDRGADDVVLPEPEDNRRLISEAVEVAAEADVIILAIGGTEQTSREAWADYHLGDRTRLDLVGEQNELFDALQALGRPVVVCAINGRPPSWPHVAARANAMLECWYPGQEGGTAIAEALFGLVNPGAKLPVTVPREVGQVPYYYNHKPSAMRGYLFAGKSPLFPFGHGLSYTTFELGEPRLSAARIAAGEPVTVSVKVRNVGKREGDEVVQVYVRDRVASVTRPVWLLKGFRRVTLAPGRSTTVRIELPPRAFTLWDARMQEVIEPGDFDIGVGPDSVNLQTVELGIV